MSFKGDLEHLPIVDVIQLMNSSRKSGILSINGRKGESQLVFKEGYIVSANHLNNSVRIGALMVKSGIITELQLEQALQKQQIDGANRKPLIITLLELGLVKESEAYSSLQQLIEMTIVEVLTWKKGTFTLEALSKSIESEFKYYPERMNLEINLNTQSMLMDALRVFDEKMRDGLLPEDSDDTPETLTELLSEDDLGLSGLEQLPAPLPKPFSGLTPFDPLNFQREKLDGMAAWLPPTAKELLAHFLAPLTPPPLQTQPLPHHGDRVVLFSNDRLLTHALTTACSYAGISLEATGEGAELEAFIKESLNCSCRHLVILDYQTVEAPLLQAENPMQLLNRIHQQYPDEQILQLTPATDFNSIMEAYQSGARAVIPKPRTDGEPNSFVAEFMLLLKMLPAYIAVNATCGRSMPASP